MTWKEAVLAAMRAVSPDNSSIRNQEVQSYIEKYKIRELNNTVEATISKTLEFLEQDGKVEKIDHGLWKLKNKSREHGRLKSKKVVIVGGVAAGPKAACHLKRSQPNWDVTVVDQDNLISYGGCGIPYYVGGDVAEEKELRSTSFNMVRDASFFAHTKGVEVLTRTRALAIDRQNKKLQVKNLDSGEEQELPYDKLMLATGAAPVILPIPGADLDGVFTVADLHKAIEIKKRIAGGKVGQVVVIGGGAIGLEMAESFADLWGLETTLVEFMPQLLPRLIDADFATMLQRHLEEMNVTVFTGEGATEIVGDSEGRAVAVKTPQRTLEADLVIMAAGVRPRSELAQEAGLAVEPWGGITVNNRLQTSDPDIYAAGDCIAVKHLVTGKQTFAPMGSLANREGRVAADNMAGLATPFEGAVGSFIMKAFDRCIAATGITYEAALAEGFDADYSLTAPDDRAHFFPTSASVVFQLVFDKRTRQLLGLQCFGMMNDSISARINAAAVMISKRATIKDCMLAEMAYAPPFSAAVDSLNAAACVADNICAGRMRSLSMQRFSAWMDDFSREPDWLVLDIRHPAEAQPFVKKFGAEKWLAIVYDKVRMQHSELPTDKTLILFCGSGNRAYDIQIFLDYMGLHNSLVLGGGMKVIRWMGAEWLPQS